MTRLKSDRIAEAIDAALTNGCFRHDHERLSEPVRAAIELLLHASVDHPFFSTSRVAALLTMVAEHYRQSLHRDDKPQPRHTNPR